MFTSYIDLLYPTEDRNERLRDSYFFTCECRECTTKDKVSPLMGRRRRVHAGTPTSPHTQGILTLLTHVTRTGRGMQVDEALFSRRNVLKSASSGGRRLYWVSVL